MASATDIGGNKRIVAEYLKRRLSLRGFSEGTIRWIAFLCAFVCVLTTLAIVYFLIAENIPFFQKISPWAFLMGREWSPMISPHSYGVLPLINGTFMVAIGAGLFAIPLGLASAIYLSEFATPKQKGLLKPLLEVLAGIPTVVYGFFALTTVTPLLKNLWPSVEIFNAASGAIVVGIMILPLISSLCEDALSAVPQSLREGAYALGATKFEVTMKVVVPGALSGIMSSFILAISRAVGETMAVTLAAGSSPKMGLNFGGSIQTMTAYIVQVTKGDTPHGSIAYQTIFAVGLTLFIITFGLNMLAKALVKKYRRSE